MQQKHTLTTLLGIATLAMTALTSQGQQIVFNSLDQAATAGYSELNVNNPIFGDSMTLSQAGHLSFFGCSVYNSSSGGNTGSILTGSMTVNFYDNTVLYSGGFLAGSDPLLGSATFILNFGTGLQPGFYTTISIDLISLNINLPQNVLITQQFTETTGTSTRNGIILFNNPTIGSSPSTVYISSTGTTEGLYTFTGNPGQFGFHVEVVPEPSTLALAGLAGAAALILRRRKTA